QQDHEGTSPTPEDLARHAGCAPPSRSFGRPRNLPPEKHRQYPRGWKVWGRSGKNNRYSVENAGVRVGKIWGIARPSNVSGCPHRLADFVSDPPPPAEPGEESAGRCACHLEA